MDTKKVVPVEVNPSAGRTAALLSLSMAVAGTLFGIVFSRTSLFANAFKVDGHYLSSTVLVYKIAVLGGLTLGWLGLLAAVVARIRARDRKPLAAGVGALLSLVLTVFGVFLLLWSVYLEVHACPGTPLGCF